ncbi:MAG: hypothetical protein ACYC0V_11850 [Armatimonadota bacterium]
MSRFTIINIITIIIAILGASTAHAQRKDLIKSGGFECTVAEFRTTWELPWGKTASLDSDMHHSGTRSLKLDGADGKEDVSARQFIPVDTSHGGRLFQVTLWMKMKEIVRGTYAWETARCYLSTFDAEDKQTSLEEVNLSAPAIGTHDWVKVSRMMTAPPGAVKACLYLSLCRAHGTLWFDDVSIVDVTDRLNGSEPSSAVIHVDPRKIIGKLSCGLGWNWVTVRPSDLSDDAVAGWPDLLRRVDYNGDDWARVGIWPAYYAPKNYSPGDDAGKKYEYDFDNEYTRKLCSLLQSFKDRKMDTLLTVWRLSFDDGAHFREIPNASWLLGVVYDPSLSGKTEGGLPYSDERFAESLAAYIRYLRIDKGLTNVKYVSIWNEPYLEWIGLGSWYNRFYGIYEQLDSQLKLQGIRESVSILGTEEVGSGITAPDVASEVIRRKSPVDVVAIHDYDAGMNAPSDATSEYPANASAKGYSKAVSLLKKDGKPTRPVAITEIGAYGPSVRTGDRAHMVNMLGTSEYVVRCINAGVSGFLKWQFNLPDRTPVTQHSAFEGTFGQIKENPGIYWGWAIMMRWTAKGSSVLNTSVSISKDALGFERVVSTALTSPQGDTTVIIVNTGRKPKTISITGLSISHKFNHYVYDTSASNGLRSGKMTTEDGEQQIIAPAESINIITDSPVGLDGPAQR